ncbi:Dolichyl-phosphate-mannose--protein mannosyltransferase 2 [Gracilariopsis chorda]|uniref:Dolichyl-phosphate-mannose--protein mannosyltransferase 2 n=1 Tax=Gracilariopsis chorda TaxID=448386 RepID=A0A2V3IEB9_9FLOR|nr:Dolichyl-phosphate-mannose--protein mannosyltransferase 2 [Gracilariopsis chorda]|eukprot:PXF40417.1 Dolichyl-phosphate-mannose--protein mannosyltransferase 2 [Gracilariopsis chorda]
MGWTREFARSADRRNHVFLLALSLGLRYFRLSVPTEFVFDEPYYTTIVDFILRRVAYDDAHPPLAKITFALVAAFLGYNPDLSLPHGVVSRKNQGILFYPLREISALFGACTAPLIYAIARELALSPQAAFFAALLFNLDPLNVILSRLILTDSQLVFYQVLSLYAALRLWRTPASTWTRFKWLCITAFASSCALSVKWAALGTTVLISVESFFALCFLQHPLSIFHCICAFVLAVSWYAHVFHMYFSLMRHAGPRVRFLLDTFRATLLGDPHYNPQAVAPSFAQSVVHLHRKMFGAITAVTNAHAWHSYWYQWIVNWRGLLMHTKQFDPQRWQIVYLISNPAISICCFLCTLIFLTACLLSSRYPKLIYRFESPFSSTSPHEVLRRGTFLLFGWLLHLLPYAFFESPAFLYHYLPALVYVYLLSALVVDQLPIRLRTVFVLLIISAAVACYVYLVPWIYCFPLEGTQHAARRWWGRWD